MSDQGFDFKRAPERREKGHFEIPPWEQDAFDEMQRKRQEEQAEEPPRPEAPATPTPGPQGGEEAAERKAEQAPSAAGAESDPGGSSAKGPEGAASGPSDAEIVNYLERLASEEPSMEKGIGVVTLVTAIVLLPTGIMLLVWGVGGMVKASVAMESFGAGAGTQMQLAAGTMMLFGAGFIAGAAWLLYRYLRQRGVI